MRSRLRNRSAASTQVWLAEHSLPCLRGRHGLQPRLRRGAMEQLAELAFHYQRLQAASLAQPVGGASPLPARRRRRRREATAPPRSVVRGARPKSGPAKSAPRSRSPPPRRLRPAMLRQPEEIGAQLPKSARSDQFPFLEIGFRNIFSRQTNFRNWYSKHVCSGNPPNRSYT